MQNILKPFRMAIIIMLPFALAFACLLALYNLQIVHGEAYYEESRNNIVTRETVPATRGKILDRYGRTLVSNRISYNISVERLGLVADPDPNGVLLRLVSYAEKAGINYTDELPLSADPPYDYPSSMTERQQGRLSSYLKHFKIDENISAENFFAYLKSHYSVPASYSDAQVRTVIGIRYELELRSLFDYIPAYVFSYDIGIDLISVLMEQHFPGVSITSSSIREYHTPYAAHLLGSLGLMDSEDYAYYGPLGYPMNAYIGKDGMEKAFEEYLRGIDGERAITRNAAGAITNVLYTEEPVAGSNVVLTIDLEMQEVAESALESTINLINSEKAAGKELAEAGAVVAVEVKTGDVLVSASYPTYSLATYSEDIMDLLNNPASPLLNRATQGLYEPGSTYKIVTAIAALNEGELSSGEYIHDEGILNEYSSYNPSCWVYPGGSHGSVNVSEAITVSCNYFFYVVGLRVKIDRLSQYTTAFGLGLPTGIEIYEETGIVATREYKEENFNEDWYPGDTLQASMGQSYNNFTPMQLASYTATIANKGIRYSQHFLKSVRSSDDSQTLYEYNPKVLSTMNVPQEYFSIVQQGMLGVSRSGTASEIFGYYEVDVGSKTGTVQLGAELENNAVFIAFAPFDNPQIAVAVVVEKGGAGSAVTQIAKSIFDYYFSMNRAGSSVSSENQLIR